MSHEPHNSTDTHTPPAALNETPRPERPFVEVARFALIALIIVLPIRWYVAQPFIVSGASMEETFQNNEYLIVDQITYRLKEPERGDVIIFRYPKDPSKYFIKRIIGLPGEALTIDGERVIVKSEKYPDGLILEEPYAALGQRTDEQSTTLGDGEYFVMGDNRDHSSDSRTWGVLRREEIVGRALLRLLPPSRAEIMPGAIDKND